jgi:DNA-binding NtrC family response regulator
VVLTVLVVESDPAMRRMVVDLLDARGIGADSCESAEAALETLRSREFNLILSDIGLPAKDGFDLVRELQELGHRSPVVLMTSFGGADTARRAKLVGAFGYLDKPFQPDELYRVVEQALGNEHGSDTASRRVRQRRPRP